MVGIGSIVEHNEFGKGVVVDHDDDFYTIYFSGNIEEIGKSYSGLSVLEASEVSGGVDVEEIEDALENVLYKNGFFDQPVKLGDKWQKGKVVMHPHDSGMQSKEVPMETFFKKITSVREKLRVLEQNINNHGKLDEEDKIHLQQYISRAYGSLTTFNVLFAYKDDHFKGGGK